MKRKQLFVQCCASPEHFFVYSVLLFLMFAGPAAEAQFTIPGDDSANYRLFNGEHHIKEDSQWYRYNPKSKLMDPLKNGFLTIRFNDNLDSAAQAEFAAENHLTRTFYSEDARYIEYRYDSFATNGIFDIAETIKSAPVVSYVRLNRYTKFADTFSKVTIHGRISRDVPDEDVPIQWHINYAEVGLNQAWHYTDRRNNQTADQYGSPTTTIGFLDQACDWENIEFGHNVYKNNADI